MEALRGASRRRRAGGSGDPAGELTIHGHADADACCKEGKHAEQLDERAKLIAHPFRASAHEGLCGRVRRRFASAIHRQGDVLAFRALLKLHGVAGVGCGLVEGGCGVADRKDRR